MRTRRKPGETAADFIVRLDPGARIIVNELAESAVRASLEWSYAIDVLRRDPDLAMTHMANVQVELEAVTPLKVRDVLSSTRRALEALEEETERGGSS